MVEMLGVLAIIGVLSVGAIAGYSKAMFKYKMNKTMDIISHGVSRLVELSSMNTDNISIMDAIDMRTYGIMPEYYCDGNDRFCRLPLGQVFFYVWGNNGYQGYINIRFLENSFDSCVAFLSSDIYKNVPDGWGSYIMAGRICVYNKAGKGCNNNIKTEITLDEIEKACKQVNENDALIWWFDL